MITNKALRQSSANSCSLVSDGSGGDDDGVGCDDGGGGGGGGDDDVHVSLAPTDCLTV